MKIKVRDRRFLTALALSLMAIISITGCTSLGHEDRAIPQIARDLTEPPTKIALAGSGELYGAVALQLTTLGIEVVPSANQAVRDSEGNLTSVLATRYSMDVTSVDLDACIPEGSRQMNFNMQLVDLVNNERMFVLAGDYGCKDTLMKSFHDWLQPQLLK